MDPSLRERPYQNVIQTVNFWADCWFTILLKFYSISEQCLHLLRCYQAQQKSITVRAIRALWPVKSHRRTRAKAPCDILAACHIVYIISLLCNSTSWMEMSWAPILHRPWGYSLSLQWLNGIELEFLLHPFFMHQQALEHGVKEAFPNNFDNVFSHSTQYLQSEICPKNHTVWFIGLLQPKSLVWQCTLMVTF